MDFCHEWKQVHDGAMMAQQLSPDLRSAVGSPFFLFSASEAAWARPLDNPSAKDLEFPAYVTDGPCLFRLSSGKLIMLWSSFGDHGYAIGIARSQSGTVLGRWVQEIRAPVERRRWPRHDRTNVGWTPPAALHQPNNSPHERAGVYPLREMDDTVVLESTDDGDTSVEKPRVDTTPRQHKD